MSPRVSIFCVAAVVAFTMAGCSSTNDDAQVVVYTSVDRIFSEPVLKAAEAKLGFNVIGVYDTEETKSTGVVNRLIAKKDNPDGDIFWSGDPARAAILKSKGVTAAYDSPEAHEIPEPFKDPDRQWVGFSARTRVLLVNTNLVRIGEEPRSIFDLTDSKWDGQVAIANPLFGTTSFHVAALFAAVGEKKALSWLNGLKANDVVIVASNGEVKRQVASGMVSVGLTDSDDAREAIDDGQPVRAVLLDQDASSGDPLGNLVIPNTVSLIRGGPNPERAKEVIDFLLSKEAMTMLAESCAQAPLRPGVPIPADVIALDGVVPMTVDYAATAERLESIMPMLKEWASQQ